MNADAVFHYGHLTLVGTLEALPLTAWDHPGVCGAWSARQVVAHLASYELVTADIFSSLLQATPTPLLDRFRTEGAAFNDTEVARRAGQSAAETLAEYQAAHDRAAALLARIPPERRRQAGLLPWYGAEYDLEDVLAYLSYGHKREHGAQIAAFVDLRAAADAA